MIACNVWCRANQNNHNFYYIIDGATVSSTVLYINEKCRIICSWETCACSIYVNNNHSTAVRCILCRQSLAHVLTNRKANGEKWMVAIAFLVRTCANGHVYFQETKSGALKKTSRYRSRSLSASSTDSYSSGKWGATFLHNFKSIPMMTFFGGIFVRSVVYG